MACKFYKDRINFTKELLEKEYITNGLSQAAIGKKYGYSDTRISIYMKKFNISVRDISLMSHLRQANHCNLSAYALEFIDGELLGDMHISARNGYAGRIDYGTSRRSYLLYLKRVLESFGIKGSRVYKNYGGPGSHNYGSKRNFAYYYSSLRYVELLDIRKRWYPEGKKRVPKDIQLTPLVCKQWYIGDGHLKKQYKYSGFNVQLITCGFLEEDIKLLIKKFNILGFKATMQANKIINLSAESSIRFLTYIGKCPIKCYEYKWGKI